MAHQRSFIDEVRRSADALQVIGEVVALKRRGSRWVGLCPFHSEKTPSFGVTEEGLWHCFGCGAGGDIFRFVMEQEAVGFTEAVRSLAERAGIPVPQSARRGPAESRRAIDKRRVLAALAAADSFYRSQLAADAGARAREFLVERGFDDDTVRQFGLGYAPAGWDAAQRHLLANGFREAELEIAGVVKQRDSGKGSYDRLRDRVVFPIRDLRGQTIAFGGRVIDSGEPKYLNSPETPTFNKSRTLYGLREARDTVVASGFAILVEGYFDLLACAQYGFRNAVAPLGTACTADHAKLLARFARKAIVGFDGDTAGQAAAERAVAVFLGQGFQVNVVRLPRGDDPDSFLREHGADALRAALKDSDSGLEFMIRRAGERSGLDTPRGKADALNALVEFVVPITDRVERAEWVGRLSQRLEVEPRLVEAAVRDARGRLQRRAPRHHADPQSAPPPPPPDERGWKADLDQVAPAERDLLRAVFDHPEWAMPLAELCAQEDIRDARVRALLAAIDACREEGEAIDAGNVLGRCELPGCEPLLSRLRLEEAPDIDWDAARNCALGIHDDGLKRQLHRLTREMKDASAAGDLERFGELNKKKTLLAQALTGSA